MDDMQRSCREFTEVLASSAPTPGGGGAAALLGAVGASLGCMVANLTVGKPKYAAVEEEVMLLRENCDALRLRLLDGAQADAEGFLPLAAAYGIASLVSEEELSAEYIIPKAFDPRVGQTVAKAVYDAAIAEGVARI